MIRKAVWHMLSTEILTRIWLTSIALIIGAFGVRYISPWIAYPAGLVLFVLIYRFRYRHF